MQIKNDARVLDCVFMYSILTTQTHNPDATLGRLNQTRFSVGLFILVSYAELRNLPRKAQMHTHCS